MVDGTKDGKLLPGAVTEIETVDELATRTDRACNASTGTRTLQGGEGAGARLGQSPPTLPGRISSSPR